MLARERGSTAYTARPAWEAASGVAYGIGDALPVLCFALLAVSFLARLGPLVGLPRIVNFAHFPLAALVAVVVLPRLGRRDVTRLTLGLLALLSVIIMSALWSEAGVINAVLEFLLLAEPFLLLLAITGEPWPEKRVRRFVHGVLGLSLINVAIIFHEYLVLGERGDDVQGVFAGQGAGAHVAGAVAFAAAAYFATYWKDRSAWIRVLPLVAALAAITFSDSKQVLAVCGLALVALAIVRATDLKRLAVYLGGLLAVVGLVVVAALSFFPSLTTWTNVDRGVVGLEQKLTVFPIMARRYDGPLDWVVGLGPGHTVGRLAEMLPDYANILGPLGATSSSLTLEVIQARDSHWITTPDLGSSMWSQFFSWAGVWGDLGLLGIAACAYLWWIVYRRYCVDDVSRFLLFNVLIFGAVFSWLEEPGYMLIVMTLIGVGWQMDARPRPIAGMV